MPWEEEWRSADRPKRSEIPDEYGFSASSTEKRMIAYFSGTTVFSYLAMKYVGTLDVLVAGLPVMMWVMLLISALVVIGLYIVFTGYRANNATADLENETGVNDD